MSGSPSIPRIIHQMWIDPTNGPPAKLPGEVQEQVNHWPALNPGYIHKLWTLHEVLELCTKCARPDVAAAIRQCRFPAMQADIARLLLLLEFGGFWSDLKLRPRVPMPAELHGFRTVLTEHFPKPDLPVPGGLLVNGFMGSMPGAPVIACALDLVMENVQQRQGKSPFLVTGPGALTTAWRSYRLTHPDSADTVLVIPHLFSWGVLWDVGSDSYNRPGMHWLARQQRQEPLFVDDAPANTQPSGTASVFKAVPGNITGIDRIFSRQGFHPFEPTGGFCWLSEAATSRIFFEAFLPFDRLRLRMYAVDGVAVSEVLFLLNGMPTPSRVSVEGGNWGMVELGPFRLGEGWNHLTIRPPRFVAANSNGGADRRKLSVAVAWLQPWISERG